MVEVYWAAWYLERDGHAGQSLGGQSSGIPYFAKSSGCMLLWFLVVGWFYSVPWWAGRKLGFVSGGVDRQPAGPAGGKILSSWLRVSVV